MDVFQAGNFTRHAGSETTKLAPVHVPLVHILKSSGGSRLPKINSLVVTICVSNDHEAAAANTGVVHADNANTEGRANEGVHGITALGKQALADLTAFCSFGGDTACVTR